MVSSTELFNHLVGDSLMDYLRHRERNSSFPMTFDGWKTPREDNSFEGFLKDMGKTFEANIVKKPWSRSRGERHRRRILRENPFRDEEGCEGNTLRPDEEQEARTQGNAGSSREVGPRQPSHERSQPFPFGGESSREKPGQEREVPLHRGGREISHPSSPSQRKDAAKLRQRSEVQGTGVGVQRNPGGASGLPPGEGVPLGKEEPVHEGMDRLLFRKARRPPGTRGLFPGTTRSTREGRSRQWTG